MAIAGDLRTLGAFNPPNNLLRLPLFCSSSYSSSSTSLLSCSKFNFSKLLVWEPNNLETKHRFQHALYCGHNKPCERFLCSTIKSDKLPSTTINQDADGFLLNAVRMSFLERLTLAWKILFPKATERKYSNAKIAKQRLKMILFAERCSVSVEAKQKIVSNIIQALSDFVEIESEDKVQLIISNDQKLGSLYSVTVPVRRVKPGFRESDEEFRGITGVEFKDTGENSGCIDVKFDFYLPNEK